MSKKAGVLGIDLGTSSVKMLLKYEDGASVKIREGYEENTPSGWWKAVKTALSELKPEGIAAIGLTSQVGTYIVDGKEVLLWSGKEGAEELVELKENCDRKIFLEEISMPHPDLISYPLPRLMYMKKRFPEAGKVCQPKDFLCERLTGTCITDPYSWRGLANLSTYQYSRKLLERIGFSIHKLPEMRMPTDMAGRTKEIAWNGTTLPGGIPVFVGMNDFFASLLGMGVFEVGDLFDISGTSEHLGVLEEGVNPDTELVSGPYLNGNVHYGVTASAGVSLDYGLKLFGFEEVAPIRNLRNQPPVFLPYLNGERAPIWDADARGMFFGIHGGCGKSDMAYAVLEGVLFSLYHIYESMGKPPVRFMRVSGGAAVNQALNQMKAEMFGIPVLIPEEADTSALGACMTAAVGLGRSADFSEAIRQNVRIRECIQPCGKYQELLKRRFEIYKELYPATKKQCKQISFGRLFV